MLANNFVLVRFLGLCPFMGVSNKLEGAIGMSVATAFVLTLSSVASYLLHRYLLEPLALEYLSTLSFILVIAVTVQLTEMVMRRTSPLLYRVLGIFLPLITSNCAVLGVALLNVQEQHNLLRIGAVRLRRCGRLRAGAGHVLRHARTPGLCRCAGAVPGRIHRADHRRA